jgi:two-component system, LytTR family, response regulator AlgR
MSLRVLIVDDEPLARERLGQLVTELGHAVCADAADAPSALANLASEKPDVALLDIRMPGPDGLSVARQIAREYPETRVVMVTAYPDHALAAFDAAVRDYVLKPVRKERLAEALGRIQATPQLEGASNPPQIRLTIGRREQLVGLDEINCFVADQGYVIALSAKLAGFVGNTLHALQEAYPDHLLRVHRSVLAVKPSIAGFEARSATDHRLLFRDGLEPVAISRRHLSTVKAFLRRS